MKRTSLFLLSVWMLVTFAGISIADAATAQRPWFQWCRVFSCHNGDGTTSTYVDAFITDPNGAVSSTINSVLVEGPGGFSVTMTAGDLDPIGGDFYKELPNQQPVTGQYKFTLTDTSGNMVSSYFYLVKVDILPVVDSTSMLAIGSLDNPTLSWADVSSYNGNLFFYARVFDAAGNQVWDSGVLRNTTVTVPSGVLDPSLPYKWRVTALDYNVKQAADNRSKTAAIPLTIDNTRSGFIYARLYTTNSSTLGQVTTGFDAAASNTGVVSSIVVTGPNGFSKRVGGRSPGPGNTRRRDIHLYADGHFRTHDEDLSLFQIPGGSQG